MALGTQQRFIFSLVLCCAAAFATAGGDGTAPQELDEDLVLRRKSGPAARVRVWHGKEQPLVVSCKGQVFDGSGKPLVGCADGGKGCGEDWVGCDFFGGTCVWDSDVARVSKKQYCLQGGLCVPHAPVEEHPGGPLDKIVVLTQPQWGAYYHFVVDSLSRFAFVLTQFPAVVADAKTFFHTGMVSEVGQMWASLVGIKTSSGEFNRLLDGWWTARHVYFPPGNDCANKMKGADPFAVWWMRKQIFHSKLLAPFDANQTAIANRTALIVQRDPRVLRYKEARVILNHDDVVSTVRQALPGWEVVVFSDYPTTPDVVTTCQMFRSASIIIGTHGAGLSNLMCARKRATVIEFQQKPHAWDFQLLAVKLTLRYIGIPTEMKHYGPGTVDLAKLREAVSYAMAGKTPGRESADVPSCPAESAASNKGPHLDKSIVLASTTGAAAEVVLWKAKGSDNLLVSCKGQVFRGNRPLVGHGGMAWDGCDFNGGTCVWDSDVSHVSKRKYCLVGGTCVPHAPDEKSPAGPLQSIVVLTQPQWGAYYHFLIDAMSRLMWVRAQYPALLEDEAVFFHTGMVSEVGQAWARLAGIPTSAGDRNRLLDGYWTARSVYFPPGNECANLMRGASRFVVQAMNTKVISSLRSSHNVHPPPPDAKRIALVIRRDPRVPRFKDARVILNHDSVVAKLSSMLQGWEVRVFSDYPNLPDPVVTCSMFYQASMIIGPHGAGLSNLICAREGTPVVEFQQEPHSWDFELLSMKLGLPYVGLPIGMEHYGPGTVKLPELRKAVLCALFKLPGSATPLRPKAAAAAQPAQPEQPAQPTPPPWPKQAAWVAEPSRSHSVSKPGGGRRQRKRGEHRPRAEGSEARTSPAPAVAAPAAEPAAPAPAAAALAGAQVGLQSGGLEARHVQTTTSAPPQLVQLDPSAYINSVLSAGVVQVPGSTLSPSPPAFMAGFITATGLYFLCGCGKRLAPAAPPAKAQQQDTCQAAQVVGNSLHAADGSAQDMDDDDRPAREGKRLAADEERRLLLTA